MAGTVLVLYYAGYSVLSSFVEPLGWFGAGEVSLDRVGWWGNAALLALPAISVACYFVFKARDDLLVRKYLGVKEVSAGHLRREAFQDITARAERHLIIVGIGMTQLIAYDLRGLGERAQKVSVDFLMLDPELLESDPTFSSHVEHFFDIPDFTRRVRSSFERLKVFCEAWNADSAHVFRMRLRVYKTIPTISMVIIDPDEARGEILMEFFLYQSGAHRLRFRICKADGQRDLFSRVVHEFNRLWSGARQVV